MLVTNKDLEALVASINNILDGFTDRIAALEMRLDEMQYEASNTAKKKSKEKS